MFRCNQCPKGFEDHSAIKRHLSTKHFFYFPYSCQICTEADENHTTATEEDMEKHIEALHPGSDYNITTLKKKDIEDKIKAVIEECQSISQNISANNTLYDQSPFGRTTTESGSISSHVRQEQNIGIKTENVSVDDIEIVYESVPQKVKDEESASKVISFGFKNALRQAYNGFFDKTSVDLSVKERSNNEATENMTADKNDDYHWKMFVQRESNHDVTEHAMRMHLQSSPNKSTGNLIQRKRALPMNDSHRRTKLSSNRSNPKQTNSTEKVYKCNHCIYACTQKNTLDNHVRTHTHEKPFKCGHCSYACAKKSTLDNHVRTHTGEKPYKCDQCPYASAQRGTLTEHMRTHTGEKPFKCSLCSFASATSSSLKVHIRTHTGEKPYKCPKCAFAGIHSGQLQCHVRNNH